MIDIVSLAKLINPPLANAILMFLIIYVWYLDKAVTKLTQKLNSHIAKEIAP